MPDYDEICRRWAEADARESIIAWNALRSWMAAESLLALVNELGELADSMATLSGLARQRAIDLEPMREVEAWAA